MDVPLQIKPLYEDSKIPSRAYEDDAGLDIYSYESLTIPPHERRTIRTGVAMGFPKGNVMLVWDKSGHAKNNGITILGGVIDAGYRNEYQIILYNTDKSQPFEIKKGDKIAQLLFQPVNKAILEIVVELDETSRGTGGFGSTGR